MGWKGTVRSINAAAKRADRNAKKAPKENLSLDVNKMQKCKS